MSLKGHTVIELTDVNTGEKEIHEDDNMITNAIKQLLGYNGHVCISTRQSLSYGTTSKYSELLRLTGGLLLFDTELEENVDKYYPPAGVRLVGFGSGISYAGNNLQAGSYNQQESGPTENGYRHVWDFNTNQANGQIACACLTTRSGGKITTGGDEYYSDYAYQVGVNADIKDEINFRAAQQSYYGTRLTGTDSNDAYFNANSVLYTDGRKNRYIRALSDYWFYNYYTSSTGDIDKFKKSIFYNKGIDLGIYRYSVNDFSIFDSRYNGNSDETYEDGLIETVHVEMPSELKSLITDDMINNTYKRFKICTSCDENFIYIMITLPTDFDSANYLSANKNVYVWKIDVNTFESSMVKVTNTTGEPIWFHQSGQSSISPSSFILDNYFICTGNTSGKMYIIELSDNTRVKVVKKFDDTDFTYGSSSSRFMFIPYAHNGKLIFSPSDGSSFWYVLDPVLGKIQYKNIKQKEVFSSNRLSRCFKLYGTPFLIFVDWNNGSLATLYTAVDLSLLITINNLASPVTKTASQTMKVTYTLTKV